jgi:hypothetical protein
MGHGFIMSSVHFTVFECDCWIKDASYYCWIKDASCYKIKTLCGITVIRYEFLMERLFFSVVSDIGSFKIDLYVALF